MASAAEADPKRALQLPGCYTEGWPDPTRHKRGTLGGHVIRRSVLALACMVAGILAASCVPSVAGAAPRPATHTEPLISPSPTSGVQAAVGLRDLAGGTGTTTTSANWAGYDDSTDGPFGTVTATWVQPRVRTTGALFSDAAFWVGLDGDSSNTVEQIGTEGWSEGVAGYDAWYEMYPLYPVTIDMPIHAGDVLSGTVTWAQPASFTLTLVDHTTDQTFSSGQLMSVPPTLASAEAIAEAPSSDSGDVLPASDYGIVHFSGCAFNGQPISAYDWNRINMTGDGGDALVARTSDLGPDGASFSVTTDCTAPHTTVAGLDARWHSRPVTLHFKAADNSGGQGVAYTQYSLDDGATWTKGTAVTVPAAANHTDDGTNKVVYRSADNVGNVENKHFGSVRIDTRRPTPLAQWPGAARRGARTALRFYVRDPRPGSPTATVTIRIYDRRHALVKKAVLRGVVVDRMRSYEFTCWLPKGSYRFAVAATDAAGNRQTAAAANTLVVR